MLNILFIFFAAISLSFSAGATSPESVLSPQSRFFSPQSLSLHFGFDDTYRIGSEWGKKPVTEESLKSGSNHYNRMALATAKIRGGGTGFYLGKFNNKHLIATNNHVCDSEWVCSGSNAIDFTKLGLKFKMSEFIGTWTEIDLAILAFEINDSTEESLLAGIASPFEFEKDIYAGQELTTIGYGIGNNPSRVMVANEDSDCLAFSGSDDYRFMADPDKLNPGPHKVWSFANGCDVSHGDSGSAMMDRNTGDVVGIIWTGVIPKTNKSIYDSNYVQSLLTSQSEVVWEQLSYAVPAVMMKKVILDKIANGKIDNDKAETLKALLGVQPQ